MVSRRIVGLTLPSVPGQGRRPFTIGRGRTEEIAAHAPGDHPWQIMVLARAAPDLTPPQR